MNGKMKVMMTALVIFFAVSCDSILKYSTIKLDTSFVQEMTIALDNATDNVSKEVTIDATSNADLEQYLDNVESYKVTAIKLKVPAYDGPESAMMNGEIQYQPEGSTTMQTIATITDLNLHGIHVNSTEVEFTIDSELLGDAQDELLETNKTSLFVTGNVDQVPITADLEFTIDVEVKAQVLKE